MSLFDEGINYDSKERKRYFTITATSTTAAAAASFLDIHSLCNSLFFVWKRKFVTIVLCVDARVRFTFVK